MNQCKYNSDNEDPHFSDKEIFEIALKARDFEIKMFWQRCNYFLLLNTSVGLVVGAIIVRNDDITYILPFLCIGMFVCLAWIKIGLGAKYWQSYWEQVLIDFQWKVGLSPSLPPSEKLCEDKDVFSKPKGDNHVNQRVKESLGMLDEKGNNECINCKKWTLSFLEEGMRFVCLFNPCCPNAYNKRVFEKPSVSRWMHRTACFFFLVWFLAFAYTAPYILLCILIFLLAVYLYIILSKQ